jgi:rubredoxin
MRQKEEIMTWRCPVCGTNDISSDLLRCSCGYESSENTPQDMPSKQQETSEFIRLEDITNCPECNSSNIEKFNTFKRGKLILGIAGLYFIVAVFTNSLGYTWYGFAMLLVYGIRALFKNKNVIVCRECMYSNNNKWLKRMKDA